MIVKDRDPKTENDIRLKAGAKVEHDVAFYLRREFSSNKDIFVINDLRVSHKGETAQIDHLVLYKKGFIIIESKSIRGEVKINKQLEWSRTIRGKWSGMPSPIEQAKLQTKLLKSLLNDNAKDLLDKIVVVQAYFGGRCWDQLCAASNDALIDRDSIPSSISKKLVKAESIAQTISKMIKHHNAGVIFNTNPSFSREEMYRIMHFLTDAHQPASPAKKADGISEPQPEQQLATSMPEVKEDPVTEYKSDTPKPTVITGFVCKKCGDMGTEPKYGKFGYYVHCEQCGTNTSMKVPCYSCGSKQTRVNKSKNTYTVSCLCGDQVQFLFDV